MPLTATTNTSANTALRYLTNNNMAASSSLAKLSSGSRVVKASDDAASLAIGTKVRADVNALKQAQSNASQAVSVLQVADGAMSQTGEILQRMKTLSVQAQSGSISDNEREFLDKEFQELLSQIDDIATQTKFNGTELTTGKLNSSIASGTYTAVDDLATDKIEVQLTSNSDAGFFQVSFTKNSGQLTLSQYKDNTYEAGTFIDSQTIAIGKTTTETGLFEFDQYGIQVELAAFDGSGTGADIAGAAAEFEVANGSLAFQVGVSSTDTISVAVDDLQTSALGGANLKDHTGATATRYLSDIDGAATKANIKTTDAAITTGNIIDEAISQVNEARASVGALISRFEYAGANLATSVENLDAARSTLLDVDMAAEMSNFSSKQVLVQASVAMLAQANQMPQNLLRLLQ
ncbi:MAG: flagellin [Geminicoccaceae bacterium]